MIASHNIKVNGRWVKAGEEYQPEEKAENPVKKAVEPKPEKKPEAETPKAEPEKAEPKAKTSPSRRKKISE